MTTNIGTYNNVSGDQQNNTYYYNTFTTTTCSTESQPPPSFNDAPLDLLSVNFTGRDDDLAEVIKSLTRSYGNVPTRCAIVGMHGIGKSQVAAKLAKDAYAQGRYQTVLWMQGTTIEKLNQGFSKLLHLVGHPDRSDPDQSARLAAARRWIEGAESGKWLLVVDNVARETVEFIQEHLPRTNSRGNILFTTRTQGVAEALTRAVGKQHGIVELRIPNVEDAAKLLVQQLKGLEIDADSVKAQEVVKCVGCLPLAVAQAAAYVKETGRTLDDVLALFQSEHKIDWMQWENDLSSYQEKSIAATFVSQLTDLERTFPDASLLLHVIAFFDPERIPLDMLTTGTRVIAMSQSQQPSEAVPSTKPDLLHRITNRVFHRQGLHVSTSIKSEPPNVPPSKQHGLLRRIKNHLVHRSTLDLARMTSATSTAMPTTPNSKLTPLLALIQSPMAFQNAITQLQNRSLTKRQYSGPTSSLWIHDLVRFIVLQHTKSSGSEQEYIDCAVQIASSAFGQIDDPTLPESWPLCEALIPHIDALASREDITCSGSLISVNIAITQYLRSQSRFAEAERLGEETLKNAERIWGPEHVNTLSAMEQVAKGYFAHAHHEEAETLMHQVLQGREKQLGSEDSATLRAMILLSDIFVFQGRYGEAETLLNRVLLSQKNKLGSEHADTVRTMSHLADVYQSQGRYPEAVILTNQVLLSQEKQYGPEHIRTLSTMALLAELYHNQGRYHEAQSLYNQVLASEEKILGPEHANTIVTMGQLATVYGDQGRYREAELLLNRARVHSEMQLGSEHVLTLAFTLVLASLSCDRGRYHEAEMTFRRVLPLMEKQLGKDQIHMLSLTSELARICHENGQYDEAEQLFDQVLARQEGQLGSEHLETLSTMYNLACLYRSQERYLEAEKLLERVLNSREKRLGPEHVATLQTLCELARVYHRLGQQSKAVTLFDRALSGQEKQLGSRHVDTLKTMHYLASLYHDQGRDEEAEKLLVDVLAHREEVLGISHPHTAETITLLADVYTSQGRLDDAQAVRRRVKSCG